MFEKVCPYCGKDHDYDTLGMGGACPEPEQAPAAPIRPRPMTAAEWLDAEDTRAAMRRAAAQQAQRDQVQADKDAVQRVIDGFMDQLRAGNPWGAESTLDLRLPTGADHAFAEHVLKALWEVGRFSASIHHPRGVGPGGRGEPMQVEWVNEKVWIVRVAKPRRG